MKDILQDNTLKQMPYSTPEGYFEGLKAGLKMIPAREAHKARPWRRVAAFAGIAASLILLLTVGALTHKRMSDMTAATEMTEDDIIEYLIYIGVEVDELEEF